jgi:hypothetical protein
MTATQLGTGVPSSKLPLVGELEHRIQLVTNAVEVRGLDRVAPMFSDSRQASVADPSANGLRRPSHSLRSVCDRQHPTTVRLDADPTGMVVAGSSANASATSLASSARGA